MPRPGRPPVLDKTKQREICALVHAGCSIEHAADYVGCSPRTINRLARRNPKFRELLREAIANPHLAALKTVARASRTHWRAAAWYLEHTVPERFAKRRQPLPNFRKRLDRFNRATTAHKTPASTL